ncbi:MAG: hypothetical protein ACI9U0_000347 [Flavobacteriales bacterium]|jgi:hypothetical protein
MTKLLYKNIVNFLIIIKMIEILCGGNKKYKCERIKLAAIYSYNVNRILIPPLEVELGNELSI